MIQWARSDIFLDLHILKTTIRLRLPLHSATGAQKVQTDPTKVKFIGGLGLQNLAQFLASGRIDQDAVFPTMVFKA